MAGAAERGVSVGCVRRDGDGAGGSSSDAGRALEGDDGVEQGASMAAHGPVGAREATESGTALRGVSQNRVARGLSQVKSSQVGGADRSEHARLEKTALPLGV